MIAGGSSILLLPTDTTGTRDDCDATARERESESSGVLAVDEEGDDDSVRSIYGSSRVGNQPSPVSFAEFLQ